MTPLIFPIVAGVFGALLVLRADMRRRHLSLTGPSGWRFFTLLDLLCPAAATGVAVGLAFVTISNGALPLRSPFTWAIFSALVILAFIWGEGRSQIQFQRPTGIVFAETAILAGASQLIEAFTFHGTHDASDDALLIAVSVALIATGGVTLAVIIPPFVKGFEGNRIVQEISVQGESVQAEYVPPTPECPQPDLWKMVDSQTSEMEVLDFLKSVVVTLKPQLIVETGTFIGYSAIKMAEGLKANGFGRIVTIEFDPQIFAKAKERIDASGLGGWIEYRNESSLEAKIDGTIDILFSDSHLNIREQEIRRFLPQISPRGLVLIHDASSHFKIVREAALRLEQEGLLSVVLLPTPRGMVIAQKREGRK